MEPLLLMALAAVVTKWITTYQEDMEYAKRGQDPPRYRLKMAQLERGELATAPARLGAKGYFRELWLDCWDDLHAHRKRVRQERADGTRPTLKQQLAELGAWSKRTLNRRGDGRPVDEDEPATPESVDSHDYCLKKCSDDCPATPPRYGWYCSRCDTRREGFASSDEARADKTKHSCQPKEPVDTRPKCGQCVRGRIVGTRRDQYGITDQLCDACGWLSFRVGSRTSETSTDGPSAAGNRPVAPVIPLFPTAKEKVMTDTTKGAATSGADTNSLAAAISFAQDASEAHQSFTTAGSEGYIGALQSFEVGDGCINLAREAQEASKIAAAKWAAHLESLKSQTTVKEAYQANPDAGNKTFLLNG